jgi:hypothetical protein
MFTHSPIGVRLGMLGNVGPLNSPVSISSLHGAGHPGTPGAHAGGRAAERPSVRFTTNSGRMLEYFNIRGLDVNGPSVALNGLYGMAPKGHIPTEFLERVEVLRGPAPCSAAWPPMLTWVARSTRSPSAPGQISSPTSRHRIPRTATSRGMSTSVAVSATTSDWASGSTAPMAGERRASPTRTRDGAWVRWRWITGATMQAWRWTPIPAARGSRTAARACTDWRRVADRWWAWAGWCLCRIATSTCSGARRACTRTTASPCVATSTSMNTSAPTPPWATKSGEMQGKEYGQPVVWPGR